MSGSDSRDERPDRLPSLVMGLYGGAHMSELSESESELEEESELDDSELKSSGETLSP